MAPGSRVPDPWAHREVVVAATRRPDDAESKIEMKDRDSELFDHRSIGCDYTPRAISVPIGRGSETVGPSLVTPSQRASSLLARDFALGKLLEARVKAPAFLFIATAANNLPLQIPPSFLLSICCGCIGLTGIYCHNVIRTDYLLQACTPQVGHPVVLLPPLTPPPPPDLPGSLPKLPLDHI